MGAHGQRWRTFWEAQGNPKGGKGGRDTYVVAFDVGQTELVGKVLGDGTLATTSRPGHEPDVAGFGDVFGLVGRADADGVAGHGFDDGRRGDGHGVRGVAVVGAGTLSIVVVVDVTKRQARRATVTTLGGRERYMGLVVVVVVREPQRQTGGGGDGGGPMRRRTGLSWRGRTWGAPRVERHACRASQTAGSGR